MGGVALGQFQCDSFGPFLDLSPVTEVACRKTRTGVRQLSRRQFGDTEPAGNQSAKEDAMASRTDGLSELAQLLWLPSRAQIHSLGIGCPGTQWTATEQPHRLWQQQFPVAPHEGRRVCQPVVRVDRATDDEPLVGAKIAHLLNRSSTSSAPRRPELPRFTRAALADMNLNPLLGIGLTLASALVDSQAIVAASRA
jgi:hypothetical protein